MQKLPNHTALKEWSSVIDSLGRGETVLLIRKGGIADPTFGVEAPRFYLYPTYFHQGESDARPLVTITHWAEVARTWEVRDLALLHRLARLAGVPPETLDARYRFRPDQALHVIGLRAFELPAPAQVQFREEYAGCRSWVSVEEEIDTEGSRPVLSEAGLNEKLDEVDALLTAAV
ncbi:MAG TPA: DUF1802 family protein [Thermoanaerobaculia bacterium]|nr:DUF1802 family protein [Thermoanaerobaculia bacterium]